MASDETRPSAAKKGARDPKARTPGRASTPIESERIEAALVEALAGGDEIRFIERVERASNYPSPRPNVDLALAIGERLASAGTPGRALTDRFLGDKSGYFQRIGLMALAARASDPKDTTKALTMLHDRADEPMIEIRRAVVDALVLVIASRGDEVVPALRAFTDGYLHAHVALEALTERRSLDVLSDGREVLERFAEAFDLSDLSPRAAERTQGLRILREAFPVELARAFPRFGEVLGFVEERLDRERPESREVIGMSIDALRRAGLRDAEAARLRATFESHGPVPRDPTRIVKGTRRRSRGR